ncbi:MAG: beta-lactamase family protein [Alteromonadaceae bacterium]|nr:beta-lactamase family protein [Alteromonadaceae bacterium]
MYQFLKIGKKNIAGKLSFCFLLAIGFSVSTMANNANSVRNLAGNSVETRQLDTNLAQLITNKNIPGVALAIVDEKGIQYINTVGVANSTTRELITENSVFEMASLSKPVFAYYAMMLAEKGIYDLQKPIFDYLPHPGFEEESLQEAKIITGFMALGHTTGMPNWSNGQKMKLKGKPGSVFSYSGEAYQYLAAAIGMSQNLGWGKELNDQINELVFTPLNMKYSSFVWNDVLAQNKVYGHKEGKPTDNTSIGNGESVGAAYSLHSSIKDYAAFVQTVINQKGLSADSWKEMLSEQIALPADHDGRKIGQIAWSLGWAIKKTEDSIRYVHTGNNHDFQSYVEIDIENKVGLVYFTNSEHGAEIYESVREVLEL